jgi:hypothetical protein
MPTKAQLAVASLDGATALIGPGAAGARHWGPAELPPPGGPVADVWPLRLLSLIETMEHMPGQTWANEQPVTTFTVQSHPQARSRLSINAGTRNWRLPPLPKPILLSMSTTAPDGPKRVYKLLGWTRTGPLIDSDEHSHPGKLVLQVRLQRWDEANKRFVSEHVSAWRVGHQDIEQHQQWGMKIVQLDLGDQWGRKQRIQEVPEFEEDYDYD